MLEYFDLFSNYQSAVMVWVMNRKFVNDTPIGLFIFIYLLRMKGIEDLSVEFFINSRSICFEKVFNDRNALLNEFNWES